MPFLKQIKSDFFREPRGGRTVWIPIVFGILLIALSIAGLLIIDAEGMLFNVEPQFMLLGVAFVLMGGTELLPADRYRVAAVLRLVTVGMFVGWLVALILAI